MQDYTLKEMMAVVAAREINNGDIIFCGTGISMLAAMAAKNISAPDCVIFFETGAIDSLLEEVPLAVGRLAGHVPYGRQRRIWPMHSEPCRIGLPANACRGYFRDRPRSICYGNLNSTVPRGLR